MFIKKYIQRAAALIMLPLALGACDYLDVVPPATADFDDTMKDRDAALGFLYSCYAGISSNYNNWVTRYFAAGDEFVEPMLYDHHEQYVNYDQCTPTAHLDGPWTNCYNNLGQCNLFIKELNELNPDNVTDADRTRWKAEIKFVRALYHQILLEAYGPIPIVYQYIPQNTAKSDFPGRSHYDACVDSIAKWYDEAAAVLPATMNITELGRGTSTAAKALKARLYLYAASPLWNGSFPYPDWKNEKFETPGYGKELVSHTYSREKWERALNACTEAINFALADGERSLFDENDSEPLRVNDRLSLPEYAGADSTFRKKVMAMRYLMSSTEQEGNHEVIFGVLTSDSNPLLEALPHGIALNNNNQPFGGWSGWSPTLYTFKHFFTANGKLPEDDPDFPDESEWFESAGLSNKNVIKLNAWREPRFYAWLSFDGDVYSEKISDGSPLVVDLRSANKTSQGYWPDQYQRDNSQTGLLVKKFIQPNIQFVRNTGGNNVRMVPFQVIRLAELYLDRAECYAALGETQKALDDLNVIRRRAGVPELTTADVTAKNTITRLVRNERFIELWGEGQRWKDLRRWMEAPERMKAGTRTGLNVFAKVNPSFEEFNKEVRIDQPFRWTNRMYMLPIQTSEIYSNPNLVQAPGY